MTHASGWKRKDIKEIDVFLLLQAMVGVIGVEKVKLVLKHYQEFEEMLMDIGDELDAND